MDTSDSSPTIPTLSTSTLSTSTLSTLSTISTSTTGTTGRAWRCTWHAGPDAGRRHVLAAGAHMLGRAATAEVHADDPALQPHHALVEVTPAGRLTITQLTGQAPVRLDGRDLDGCADLTRGTWVEVGGSLLSFTPARAGATARRAHMPDGALVRSPRTVPRWQPVALADPAEPAAEEAPGGGLLPALLGLAGAAVIALVLHQPMFVLFGALGTTVAVASWAGQRVAHRRRRGRALAAHQQAVDAARAANERARQAYRAHHATTVPTTVGAVTTVLERGEALWTRRAAHPDAFLASVGIGDVPWPTPEADDQRESDSIAATYAGHTGRIEELVTGVAVPVAMGPGSRVAIRGPQAHGTARALLVQLAASCGPADLRIVIVTDHPTAWDALRGLPHLTMPDESCAIVPEAHLATVLAELERHQGHLLLVTDEPRLLATRTSALRRAVADPDVHALLALLPAGDGVPHLCTAVLTTATGPTARWVADTRVTMLPAAVRLTALGERTAATCAAALRGLVDPEDPLSIAAGIPRQLSVVELPGIATASGELPTPAAVAGNWANAGADPTPRAIVGLAADGAVDIDLVRDGPHGLIAGTTGAGKSELLRTLVVGMALHSSPAHLSFVLVDYKGGATFDACAALPHVVGVVTDLDDHLADRALRSLHAELRRREAVLRAHGAADLAALRATAPDVLLPRLVVVIDEFAALVADQPAFLHSLVGIAQRGRSLGVHLLLATQRPNGVISDDIRANTNLRLALRLQDAAEALDVVGVPTPATLPRQVPGRAVLRLGADDHLTFQTAHCTVPTEHGPAPLHALVRAIGEAARVSGAPTPPSPWLPPLPAVLTAEDTGAAPTALGLLDDPDHQRTLPLHWSPADGHLLVAGSAGNGVTSTLATVALHSLRGGDHVYVLDGRGGTGFDTVAQHPRCGAVVPVHDRERLTRLLHLLRQPLRRRTVLVIDGLDAVRRALDDVATADEYEALEEVLTTGCPDGAGVVVVAGVEHTAMVPAAFLARCPQRWVLHLHDPHDAAVLGVSAAAVPAPHPGRAVVAPLGLAAQLVAPATALARGDAGHADTDNDTESAPRIEPVPALVPAATLADGWHADGTSVLPVGTDCLGGGTSLLHVHDGEHALVLGAARTGRSTALARLTAAWQAVHPTGWVGAIVPRRRSDTGAAAATGVARHADVAAPDNSVLDQLADLVALDPLRPTLLVVDDAEAIDDADGRLAALAAAGRTTIIAAARPDALRQTYGHWTTVVRRSRLGLVATGGSDLDGDLLGALLPRRTPLAPRPGLMWAVDGGRVQLVQVGVDTPDRMSNGTAQDQSAGADRRSMLNPH